MLLAPCPYLDILHWPVGLIPILVQQKYPLCGHLLSTAFSYSCGCIHVSGDLSECYTFDCRNQRIIDYKCLHTSEYNAVLSLFQIGSSSCILRKINSPKIFRSIYTLHFVILICVLETKKNWFYSGICFRYSYM